MTTEKAIELLNRISDSQFDGIHGDERREALSMAVRALEGDGDTISRKMAIEFIDYLLSQPCKEHTGDFVEGMRDGYYRIRSVIKYLPSAQPHWIPCSERLPEHPENDDYYLVTIQCEHYDGWDDYVTGFAEWTKHGWDELSCYIGQIKVIAWMPLPKPYGGEGE